MKLADSEPIEVAGPRTNERQTQQLNSHDDIDDRDIRVR